MTTKRLACIAASACAVGFGAWVGLTAMNGAYASDRGFHSSVALPVPVAPAESPEQAVLAITRGIADAQTYVIWDALPASYQRDITEIVHQFASKMDRETWNQSFALVAKFADVLENQRDVILALPQLQDSPEFNIELARENWHHVIAPLRTIATSEIADRDKLARIDLRQFMGTTGATLVRQIEVLNEISNDEATGKIADLRNIRATLVSRNGDDAVVRLDVPGEAAHEEKFTRVEGKWIPTSIADDWADEMAEARAELAQMSEDDMQQVKPRVMVMLASIDGVLDQLNAAATPEQFEQTAQMGMFQVFGAVMAMGQVMDAE